MTKPAWQFRPSGHWNFVPESVYKVLKKFYGSDRLRVIEGEDHSPDKVKIEKE